jgi:two-component system OmpR family sensor kinase
MIDIIEAVQLGTSIPHIDLERDIMVGMMLQFLLIFLVLSLALFIMMRFITHRLWLPFDDTLQKTEQFNLAQSVVPQFQKTEIKEFARLNNSLAKIRRFIVYRKSLPRMLRMNSKHLFLLFAVNWTC